MFNLGGDPPITKDLLKEVAIFPRAMHPAVWTLPNGEKERIRKQLARHIAGFKRLAKFAPFVAGERFTQADCAAYVSLSLVGLATRTALGEDLLDILEVQEETEEQLVAQDRLP